MIVYQNHKQSINSLVHPHSCKMIAEPLVGYLTINVQGNRRCHVCKRTLFFKLACKYSSACNGCENYQLIKGKNAAS